MLRAIAIFILVFSAIAGLSVSSSPAFGGETVRRTILSPEAIALKKQLTNYCIYCHITSDDGGDKELLNKFGDFTKAGVLQKFVDRVDPRGSTLYREVESGNMPFAYNDRDKPSEKQRQEILKAIIDWVGAGEKSLDDAAAAPPINEDLFLNIVVQDFRKQQDKANTRYISFLNTYNNPETQSDILSKQSALNKLVNSLSWSKTLTKVAAVDLKQIVFRINLKDYNWNEDIWQKLEARYPYSASFKDSSLVAEIVSGANANIPIVRGDWFLNEVSQPPLYNDFLQLPKTDLELEQFLNIDVADDIQQSKVVRAGIIDSGVSNNNRIIERHETQFGAYWKSYDFAASTGDKNILSHPLGPRSIIGSGFIQDGGEIIFNLPNGLQGYMLVNAKGARLDQAPIKIVSDPNRADRAVTNGVSCMSCHTTGMINTSDKIIQALSSHFFTGFSADDQQSIKTLYGGDGIAKFLSLDSARYLNSIATISGGDKQHDPVSIAANDYQRRLDFNTVIADLGIIQPEALQITLSNTNPELATFLGQSDAGIKRDLFESSFGDLVKDFTEYRHGIVTSQVASSATTKSNVTPAKPVESPENPTRPSFVAPRIDAIVFNTSSDNALAKVIRITSDGYTVKYLSGENVGTIGEGWDASDLAVQSGCGKGACVGESRPSLRDKGATVQIVGLSEDGTYVVKFSNGQIRDGYRDRDFSNQHTSADNSAQH